MVHIDPILKNPYFGPHVGIDHVNTYEGPLTLVSPPETVTNTVKHLTMVYECVTPAIYGDICPILPSRVSH